MQKIVFTKACLSDISVIMAIMCEPLLELLCQVVMGWIPALKDLLPGAHGTCGHVLSCQVVNTTASQVPNTW
jgi:hypothetical protein